VAKCFKHKINLRIGDGVDEIVVEDHARKYFNRTDHGEMIWGILVIPVKDFLIQSTPQKALGIPCLDTAIAESEVRRLLFRNEIWNHLDISSSITGTYDPPLRDWKDFSAEYLIEAEKFRSDMIRAAEMNMKKPAKLIYVGVRNHAGKVEMMANQPILPDGLVMLRTYKFDIELIPPSAGLLRTVLKDPFSHPARNPPRRLRNPVDVAMDRLNMLLYIQSLSLVVAGSQSGDVALLTLTCMPEGHSKRGPVTTFRLDRLLPLEKHIVGPRWPLLGLATSPVLGANRRWRLILHYLDHSLLSYELWRGDGGDLQLI
jgi:hypothetical protein